MVYLAGGGGWEYSMTYNLNKVIIVLHRVKTEDFITPVEKCLGASSLVAVVIAFFYFFLATLKSLKSYFIISIYNCP